MQISWVFTYREIGWVSMSHYTQDVKEADMATIDVPAGKNEWTIPSVPYFLWKSAPKCETQCASSTNMDRHQDENSVFWSTCSTK